MQSHHYRVALSSFPRVHWEIDYRKIIGIYRNFDGKRLHSYFKTVSEVFWELIAPNLGNSDGPKVAKFLVG